MTVSGRPLRMAEGGAHGPAVGGPRAPPQGGQVEPGGAQDGHVEARVEEDDGGVATSPVGIHADRHLAGAGDDVRVGHDVLAADGEAGAHEEGAAGAGVDAHRAVARQGRHGIGLGLVRLRRPARRPVVRGR